jgi:hypothetical protein
MEVLPRQGYPENQAFFAYWKWTLDGRFGGHIGRGKVPTRRGERGLDTLGARSEVLLLCTRSETKL